MAQAEAGMITAKVGGAGEALGSRLRAKARLIGVAYVQSRNAARQDHRWREPQLLWPLFTRDS